MLLQLSCIFPHSDKPVILTACCGLIFKIFPLQKICLKRFFMTIVKSLRSLHSVIWCRAIALITPII
ncbi:hypothetical protein KsCSTR_22020 [Candidatus Kuenenia stuttgartiensis]|uniref:Uncharacterized protein n=1 Tax=Kuenenia stuttgartiensis TaxID=174633 RepID=Q1Q385_KUEST|nr:hypothetical protein KsCSTR_22020 [Candidatus Kuenenia stuttgartiensis]CAJ74482.1 unknown protein [Candidatus Kuenenia stuttgartiensis]